MSGKLDSVARPYREKLYAQYSTAFGSQKTYDPKIQWAQFESVYRGVLPNDRGAKIADLGCGKGEWVDWLVSKGYTDVTGVDVSVSDLPHAPAGTGARWVSANVISWIGCQVPSTFDVVHLKDVVEHLDRDEFLTLLENVRFVLRPGGKIIIVTFNAQSPLSAATRYGDLTHETGFTPSSMSQGLRCVGFSAVSVTGLHYCSRSLSGRLRLAIGTIVFSIAQWILVVRHGKGSGNRDVQLHSALPDIIAVGFRT